ncbi:hypothetical protein SLEP1_g21872 [Rubroshorea leprosula]|uniref:Uncharacterized protein n=1 Tax=Rubroshorea leprosula TaxID=152421 RepID=A0AAV5J7E8_9ROSI|nr:hypothetical protein SLEP1_g21872 [Rubroshorea leprosula]
MTFTLANHLDGKNTHSESSASRHHGNAAGSWMNWTTAKQSIDCHAPVLPVNLV